LLATLASAPAAGQAPERDLQAMLARVGARVLEWYSRAQSIVSDEVVSIQTLRADMAPTGPPRRLAFELRVDWDPDSASPDSLPEARIVRQLLLVNGRAPGPRDEPGCMDPKGVSTEPLTMLLPDERRGYRFAEAGTTRVDGRDLLVVDFTSLARRAPEVAWRADCVSVSLPGWSEGRVWIDTRTYDVVRLDERLTGQFGFDVPFDLQRRGAPLSMTIERADSSIRYRRVEFQDPPEALMLPASVDTVTVVRGGGIQRNRISQRYSGHRRFLADARVVP
jgi:hypothetical protein